MFQTLFIVALVLSVALIIWTRVRDQKYLHKKTREVLGQDLKKEIEKEKEDFKRHQTLFAEALSKAKQKKIKGHL